MKVKIFTIVIFCGVLLISGCIPEFPPWSKPAVTVLSHYTFDTGDGTLDSGPGGHTGTLVGSPELAEGKSGQGLKLDGANGMTIPEDAVKVARSFTAAAWLKIDPGSPAAPCRILSVGCVGSNSTGFLLAIDTSYGRGAIIYCIGNKNGTAYWNRVSQLSIESRDGKWHHIAVAFDLDKLRAVGYIDGEKIDEVSLPAFADPAPTTGITNCIGGFYHNSEIGEGVVGVIDDVVVINGFLKDADIPHIMDSTIF
jgi:hypothetical protein